MYGNIDAARLADVQNIAAKLEKLPEKALLYIAGYTEGALDNSSTPAERDGA